MEADNFTFLPPIILTIFGTAFLIVWRYGSRPALWWAAGFFGHVIAFSGELVLATIPDQLRTMIIDAFFIASYFAFSQALGIHLRVPQQTAGYAAFSVATYSVIAYAVLVQDSLRMELLVIDTACALLLLLPLRHLRTLPANKIDRFLLAVIVVAALDILIRSLVFAAIAPSDAGFEDFASSGYATAAQISATVVGLVFALVALGAVALDVVNGYREAAETDPLTGLLNRRGFETIAAGFLASSQDGLIVTCDIDRFKQINDEFGHATGDQVIAAFARLLTHYLPQKAAAARFGGEEFVVFLSARSKTDGVDFAETVRRELAGKDFSAFGINRPITASFGVARTRETDRSIHDAITRADGRMYVAKSSGRNRVVADGELEDHLGRMSRPQFAPAGSVVRSGTRG